MRPLIFLLCVLLSATVIVGQDTPPVITPENASQLQLFASHGRGNIWSVDWSSKGKIAIATQLGVWLYNSLDDQAPKLAKTGNVQSIVFSTDGNLLVVFAMGQRRIKIVDVESTTVVREFEHQGLDVEDLTISNDNKTLWTIGKDIWRYDLLTETPTANLFWSSQKPNHYNESAYDMVVNDQENRIYVLTSDGLYLLNLTTGVRLESRHKSLLLDYPTILALSPDKRTLAIGGASSIEFRNARDLSLLSTYSPQSGSEVRYLAYSDNETIVIGDSEFEIQTINTANSDSVLKLAIPYPSTSRYREDPYQWAVSPDGEQFLYTPDDSSVWIFSLNSGDFEYEIDRFQYGDNTVASPFAGQTGEVAILSNIGYPSSTENRHNFYFWNVYSDKKRPLIPIDTNGLTFWHFALSQYDRLISMSMGGHLVITQYSTGILLHDIDTYTPINPAIGLAQSAGVMVYLRCGWDPLSIEECIGNPMELILLNAITFAEIRRISLRDYFRQIQRLAISADGNRILAMGLHGENWSGIAQVWDVATGEILATKEVGCNGFAEISFFDNDRVLLQMSECPEDRLSLWDIQTDVEHVVWHGEIGSFVDLSPNKDLLAFSNQGVTYLLDTKEWKTVVQISKADTGWQPSFSDDGRWLVLNGFSIEVWSVAEDTP